jgi:hypothetical protein
LKNGKNPDYGERLRCRKSTAHLARLAGFHDIPSATTRPTQAARQHPPQPTRWPETAALKILSQNKFRYFVFDRLYKPIEVCEQIGNIWPTNGNIKMKTPASLARRLSHDSVKEKAARPIEITEIVKGAQGTAAYIAQLTGELATLANGARFANLALLLARAQLEAELWSCQGK